MPTFGFSPTVLSLYPCGAGFDKAIGRHFERHHETVAHPASTKYRNRPYDQSWTLVPKPTKMPDLLLYYLLGTNAGKYSRTTTQRPSTSTIALPVRISSFGNGTPETGNPIDRQKQQPLYSVGSRLSPLTRHVANESSLFGLGISHRTLQLPISFQPFPTRQNNSAAPPPPTRPVSTEQLCPGSLHCRRGAPAESPTPFSTPKCYQRAALLWSPPIPPKPRPTACALPTTPDATEPMCSGPIFPAEGHRLAMFPKNSGIAAMPSIWLGWLPRNRHRSISDTADHLETAAAVLLTAWVILLRQTLEPLPPPFHGYPGPNHPA